MKNERKNINDRWGGVNPSESAVCDICFYDKSSDKLIIVPKNKWNTTDYSVDAYTPIGVVVVPGSHNVYGDGTCGVMSLVYMDTANPDTGSTTAQIMYWGGYNVDTSLPDLDVVPYVGSNGSVGGSIVGVSDIAYLPSDETTIFTAVTNELYDPGTKYYYKNSYKYAPSPYVKAEGSNEIVRNPLYYQTTSPSTTANCLADFNGVGNTKVLTNLATGQSDWETATTIANNDGSGYFPAACCCWRYSTPGTAQGQWYLPAAGEFGYVVVRLKAINETIAALITAYGSTQISSVASHHFWSSSEYSGTGARGLSTSNGYVNNGSKTNIIYVRAFLRV